VKSTPNPRQDAIVLPVINLHCGTEDKRWGFRAYAAVSSSFNLPKHLKRGSSNLMKVMAELTKDCLELPSAQRLKLARILLDASEPDQDFSPEVEAAWDEEIAARMKTVLNGSAKSSSLTEVLARFEKLYPA
jgi:hypothetical protein